MDEVLSFLSDVWHCAEAFGTMLKVFSYWISIFFLDLNLLDPFFKAFKHLIKTPQYFLLALAAYGAARALRLYNSNAIIQSHKRTVQSVIDKISWYREEGLEGNITLDEIDKLTVGLDEDIRSAMTDTSAIEWDGGPNLSSYTTFFEDCLEDFNIERFEKLKLRNGRYLSAADKRDTKLFLSDLIVSLEQYGAAIEQVYMLSPKIFHKIWIWRFSKEFLNSQNLQRE